VLSIPQHWFHRLRARFHAKDHKRREDDEEGENENDYPLA
jgi:hypothetical protein